MRKLIIFTAFIASLAGVCAVAVQNRWLMISGNQVPQKNGATDDLPSLRGVSSPSWLDGAAEALGRQ